MIESIHFKKLLIVSTLRKFLEINEYIFFLSKTNINET